MTFVPRRRGHTLSELLVVLFILALFAVIVIPRFAGTMFSARADAAIEALRADLGFARSRAVSTGVRHQVVVDTQSGEVMVVPYRPEDQAGTGAAAPNVASQGASVVHRDRLPDTIKITTWSSQPLQAAGTATTTGELQGEPITFYPEGSSDMLTLVIEDDQQNRRGLILDAYTGQTRLMDAEELSLRR